MTALTTFVWPEDDRQRPIRTVTIDGEPWFVAADVCAVLEIGNSRDAVGRLQDCERNTVVLTDGNRGNPNATVISEAGAYRLIMRSDKPAAVAFQVWLAHEVIPAIRKTGAYIANGSSDLARSLHEYALDVREAVASLAGAQVETVQRLTVVEAKVQEHDKQLSTFLRRRDFSPATKARYARVLRERYGGRCPLLDKAIMENGVLIPGAYEYDHWNGRADNREEAGWLVCKEANQVLLMRPAERQAHIYHFQTFQHFLKILREGDEPRSLFAPQIEN